MWVHFVSYFWVTYGSIVEWRLHSCCVCFGLAKTDSYLQIWFLCYLICIFIVIQLLQEVVITMTDFPESFEALVITDFYS
jgi:uncharacterized metal-binding protein